MFKIIIIIACFYNTAAFTQSLSLRENDKPLNKVWAHQHAADELWNSDLWLNTTTCPYSIRFTVVHVRAVKVRAQIKTTSGHNAFGWMITVQRATDRQQTAFWSDVECQFFDASRCPRMNIDKINVSLHQCRNIAEILIESDSQSQYIREEEILWK